MNLTKRVVIKTVLICLGVFLLIAAGAVYYIYNYMAFDTEQRYVAYVATTNIKIGDIINESMVVGKDIRESSLVPSMVHSLDDVIGKKTKVEIQAGDYIANYNLIPDNEWFTDDQRYTVVELGVKERLAGLIKKDSLIDIKVNLSNVYDIPKIVLPKVRVLDLLDEMGNSLTDNVSGKTVYAKLMLDEEQRNLLFVAQEKGTLITELYCNSIQNTAIQSFEIPHEYIIEKAITDEDNKPN